MTVFSESESCSVLSDSSRPHGLYTAWNSPDQNTGVGSLSLLQGLFPTQGSNPGVLHCRRTLYLLNHQSEVKVTQLCPTLCDPMDYTVHGILQTRILEWVAFPFSRESSQPRDGTQVYPHCRWILYQLSHKGSPIQKRNRAESDDIFISITS